MRRLGLIVLLTGCGSVEPIGPPESSGETWTGGDTDGGTGGGSGSAGGNTDVGTTAVASGTGSSSGGSTGFGTSGGTTGGATSGGQVDDSGTDACTAGELGCGCLPMNGCAEGLTCASSICVPDLPCPPQQAGMETCQCTEGGGCDAGLVCASNLCVDPDG